MPEPSRGEVWIAELSPTRGHEQAGTRHCLVVAADRLSHGPSGLTVIAPITSRRKGVPFHIEILLKTEGRLEVGSPLEFVEDHPVVDALDPHLTSVVLVK